MKNIKNKSLISDLSLFLVAIIWGGGFIAVKDSVTLIPPFYQMAIRFSLSTILMAIIFFKYIKNIKKSDIKMGFIIGFFLFVGFAFQTVGIVYTTASKSAFLTATYVVLVPFFNWFIFKDKPDKYSIIGAILCLIGIALLTLQSSTSINMGDLLTLLCGIGFAGQIITTGVYTKKSDPIILTIIQFATAAILSFLAAFFLETPPNILNKALLPSILYLVFFSTMLCFIIQNIAQKYTSSTHAAIILSLESVFGSLLSIIIFKDNFTITMFLGCIFIFMSILTTETKLSFIKKSSTNKCSLSED
ncbi:DMT family transporter [Clostridium senegalense]|uniref:DMT family transporter n=1 Tax=Clostridium senegalense TaxID=1465809 RepID=UPI001C102E2A|nr:DMT family transporter [Clostridium senegalense]MBU5227723.1 DMT family transporter [Clostridium senegalense]